MTEFSPEVAYRIQNVDLETFLERHGSAKVMMHPKKESTLNEPTLAQQVSAC